jgi:tRNA-specific 2-thiouridylase
MAKTVFLGMSGGVDSSVSALLLKKAGYDVVGVYMKCWEGLPTKTGLKFTETCDWEAERRDALRVATQLGIKFKTYDFVEEYRREVIDYFFNEYQKGRTPNPDVMCNRHIKFDCFLNRALAEGADYIATGHYAKRMNNSVYIPTDKEKDQTYFLWTLTNEKIQRVLFPLGDRAKLEVRNIANEAQLPVADKKDSQGICFVGEVPVHEFIAERLPEKIGEVLTLDGKVLGTHTGAHFYTVGQRHGMTLTTELPHYVVGTNIEKNEVYVVAGNSDKQLYKTELYAEQISWVHGKKPADNISARVRYRQSLQKVYSIEETPIGLKVVFEEGQRAVTPGQSIVFYEGEEMVGGGVIQ